MPAWYWAVPERFPNGQTAHGLSYGYFPHRPYGPGASGLWAGTMPSALLAALIAVVLFLAFNYALVVTARLHARIARALLRPHAGLLAGARRMLASPPLSG